MCKHYVLLESCTEMQLQFMLYRWRAEEVRIATVLLNVAGYGCANKHNET